MVVIYDLERKKRAEEKEKVLDTTVGNEKMRGRLIPLILYIMDLC